MIEIEPAKNVRDLIGVGLLMTALIDFLFMIHHFLGASWNVREEKKIDLQKMNGTNFMNALFSEQSKFWNEKGDQHRRKLKVFGIIFLVLFMLFVAFSDP